ncbi:GlyGly-CTERM sorting domain-containing protein [Rheinheimera sediminis]|uniref:choice-of-anchor H family protein n=1 Tax=Rheinheimera sp. YQF-1 TaxID=2499626 RepID=UPI000FD9D5D6|nr:choice-of-anchor H family protein [Rheinheimera sp. YQF-1]RVT45700.1 GlyGly-CTERM sorting domain-containing protein [Rheinheimera sp. YQF-1]
MRNFFLAGLFTLVPFLTLAAPTEVASTKESFKLQSELAATPKPKATLRSGGALIQSVENNVWFDSIDISFDTDLNKNGFYHSLYLRFDADTNYKSIPVYAHFALKRTGAPEVIIHTSSIFTLYGTSADDWFAIESDLLHSLPPAYYDLVIRLYDADYNDLLAEISGFDEPALARLPLEDYSYDKPQVVVVKEESGSLGWLSLFGLIGIALSRRKLKPY